MIQRGVVIVTFLAILELANRVNIYPCKSLGDLFWYQKYIMQWAKPFQFINDSFI